MSRYAYEGAKKSEHEKLNDAVNPFLIKGQIVTEDMKLNAVNGILNHYHSKGFIDTDVDVVEPIGNETYVNAIAADLPAQRL